VKLKGEQALLNYLDASKAVREGKFNEALSIELLPSDRKLIEGKVHDAMVQTEASARQRDGASSSGDAGSSPAGVAQS